MGNSVDAWPLFTVVIPTRNRANVLQHTLRTCMMQDYEHLDVIVSDDDSTDDTREVVNNAARIDSRIRYVSPGRWVGMRDNFEFALRQAKPGYVIVLGGDDGLLPYGIGGMNGVLRDTRMELLAWPAPVYSYPNVRATNGQLMMYRSRNVVKLVGSREFLHRQARNLHYLSDVESPMCYVKGVASTKLIERVRSRSAQGRFYSCPTPDGYSGIVLAGEVSHYAFSGKPFSIFGLSSESQGLAYMSNVESAKKSSEMFFRKVSERPMHGELASQPYSPLITLMTVDYLLTARDLPGWPGRFPPIDFRRVLAKSIGELAHGLYGEDRICRELRILNEIAERHGLGQYYREKVRRACRRRRRLPFAGSGINSYAFFLDGEAYGLRSIVDAAYAARQAYQFYCDLSPGRVTKVILRSLRYGIRSVGRGERFPPQNSWNRMNVPGEDVAGEASDDGTCES